MTSIHEQLNALNGQLDTTLLADRFALRHQIQRLRRAARKREGDPILAQQTAQVTRRLQHSAEIRHRRIDQQPDLHFDEQLPIVAQRETLLEAIAQHQVIIVAGETGSGKSTQLPKLCLAAGRGVDGRIGVTQPRRIAAITVARRISEELGETPGRTVGYQIRFQDTTAEDTRIKLMTDGILLAEIHADPYLNQYDTLIVDEAHERSLNIDFILGIVKNLLRRRPELKLIITSATLDTEKFSAAFEGAPVIQVSGRLYDVQTVYLDPAREEDPEKGYIEQAVQVVDLLQSERSGGDILIFMPTEQDIRDALDLLEGRGYPGVRIMPLFARLSAAEQQRVFQDGPGRKIVVATNVAETSITIPGIRYVIDSGLARISQYAPRSRTTTLPVSPISRSSADQRRGRCGRVANGVCFRLFSQEDYEQRPQYTPPEILRANLAEVILKMIVLGLGDVQAFPFIDPPNARSIHDGYQVLEELGAIISTSGGSGSRAFALTAKGRLMARLPLDPRLAAIVLAARQRGCLDEVAVIIAALSIQEPRERPLEKQKAADQAHAGFNDPLSDFVSLLNVWQGYQKVFSQRQGWSQVRQYCRLHFLSFRRMREWQDIYHQILQVLADHKIKSNQKLPAITGGGGIGQGGQPAVDGDISTPWYAAVHQSILSGFLSNIAVKKEKQIFQAAHGRQAMIFPGSGLFKHPGQWIVAAEMVETSRLFARCAAVIDPAWVVEVAPDLCKYTYLDPHWERRRGQVMATEQASLYGLILLRRLRPYGPVAPDEAARIFIQQALIAGDVRQPLAFMTHNRQLIDSAQDMENRLRRRDLLADEVQLEAFYLDHLGQVFDWRTLKHRIRKAGGDDFLRMTESDVLNETPDEAALAAFPDRIAAGSADLACDYQFEPGQESDGITVRVPEQVSPQVAGETLQWLVPGLLREKVAALIRGLPKEYRRQLLPINTTVDTILHEMPMDRQISLSHALSAFIHQRFNLQIPAAAWDERQLAHHLRMRIAVTDRDGKVLRSGRDPEVLRAGGQPVAPDDALDDALKKYERQVVDGRDLPDLAASITLTGPRGSQWTVFPTLEVRGPDGREVWLTAKVDPAVARRVHPQGVKALLIRCFASDVKYLKKNLRLSAAYDPHCRYFGGRPAVEARLLDRVLNDLTAKEIRTAKAFNSLCVDLEKQGLSSCGQSVRQSVINVLTGYWTARQQIFDLEKNHAANAGALALLSDLRDSLQALVPENFILLYDGQRLCHLLRYIKALAIRAQRGVVNLEKEQAKARQLAPFVKQLTRLAGELDARSSPEKKAALEAFYWMVEEYKISLFAQEVGTDSPVSAKRLQHQLELIERLS